VRISEAAYEGNLGFEEMHMFFRDAKPSEQRLMDKLLADGKFDKVWTLLKKVTGVKLKPMKSRKVESMNLRDVNKALAEEVSNLTEGYESDDSLAEELKLFIDNDSQLYRSQTTSIIKALVTRKAKGQYDSKLAQKAFMYLATNGAKKYAKDVGGDPRGWDTMFSVKVRKITAEKLEKDFKAEMDLGNYDNMLPKKYQKK